jgi:hypothetical protein
MTEVEYYLNHISSYEREFKKWEERTNKIIKRYRDETRKASDAGSRFNILWSNVQTLKAATFARLPKPDVSRRFRDNDPVGRVASLILERALDYEITHYPDYEQSLTACVYDRFLGGRGVSWSRYEPHMKAIDMPADGIQVTEDQDEAIEIIDYECAPTDYVHWKDFGHNVARTWEEVSIVWRNVYMTRAMLEERFGEEGKKIPLDSAPNDQKNKEDMEKRAFIYEIWDKEKGVAIWLAKSLGEIVDKREDPLQLEGFFPCPRPVYATLTNESLIPVPDFVLYQDQANTLDILSDRIEGLVRALQVRGVYNASEPVLARLFTEGGNNEMLPVKNWMSFSEKSGLKGAIDLVDIKPIAEALVNAYGAFEQVKAQVYDITGISDIVRGQSQAAETATAQQIKGQYASLRLKEYQKEVSRFAANLLQLKAQIICNHFDEQTILMISAADQLSEPDKQMVPQALQLLRDDPMRSFRIEISSDSMTLQDEQQEKQDRVEFLTAVSGYLEKATQAAMASPDLVPLMLDLLKFGVTGFKVGKSVEGQIDQTAEQIKQKMAQPQQPKPDPEQIKQEAETQRMQMQQQLEAQKAQMEMQQEQQMAQFNANLEMQMKEKDAQLEMVMQRNEMAAQQQLEWFKGQIELIKAQIGAEATITAQQDNAAEQALNG